MAKSAVSNGARVFDEHALAIAKRQYYQPGDEDVFGMFRRVANWVASPEPEERRGEYAERFFSLMADKKFCPGGRVLAGAATSHGNVLNCFVQGAKENDPDSMDGIMEVARKLALVTKVGGGNGVYLGVMREVGAPIKGSGGTASGPVSFLRQIYAPILRVVRQGGTRRGAGMATLDIDHPDVLDFITAKDHDREEAEGRIETFNISVLATDKFMAAVKNDEPWYFVSRYKGGLVPPGEVPGKYVYAGHEDLGGKVIPLTPDGGVKARWLLDQIAEHAWATGEPGLIFIDRINAHNAVLEGLGEIKATNPCVTADTWVQTHLGARQVRELVGRRFCVVVDGKRYGLESQGFWSTGTKPVFRLKTRRGFELRLTGNHKLKKVTKETRHVQESEWQAVESLAVGDSIVLSNHRRVAPWSGRGGFTEGWLLGALVGDGTFAVDKTEPRACLDFWGEGKEHLEALAAEALQRRFGEGTSLWITRGDDKVRLASSDLAELAASYGIVHGHKTVTDEVEEASFDFYQGFLCALFDTDGAVQGNQDKGVSVRLAPPDRALLTRVQRMLARLGIMSTLYAERRPEGYRSLPDAQGGNRDTYCRADHELVITNDNLLVFQELVNFEDLTKQKRLAASIERYRRSLNRERFSDTVVAIEPDGEEEVFDVTVERIHEFDANGISAHNCGEIPLLPGEPCDLGAINLAEYVTTRGIGTRGFDWDTFREDVATCTRFLDNVLEVNHFALDDNREMSQRLRRLGLGVMGLADALIKMGLAYDSEAGREAVREMIGVLRDGALQASKALAEERGAFPDFDKSSLQEPRRNVALLTVAPTGTTSMLMGVSSGIEPVFAPFIYRKIGDEYKALIHPLFRELLDQHPPHPDFKKDVKKDSGWDWERVVNAVQANHGSVQGLDFVPQAVRDVLICAHDVAPDEHVRMQAAVQTTFDEGGAMIGNSISKTINMANEAKVEDVHNAYSLAYELGCKGITVYRDGSRDFQVLSTSTKTGKRKEETAKEEPSHLPGEPLFERPGRLTGFTDNVKLTLPTGERRSFYITVNKQEDTPTEVFINAGKAGDESNADSEALGRMVSIALQYGVPAEAVVKTLRGINGGMYGSYGGRMVASKADLIAIALETAGVENALAKGAKCPEDCDGVLVREEGCLKCYTCGYSKCG